MPKGPRGEKRPADAVGLAVHVARIATGEIDDTVDQPAPKGRQISGKARAEALTAAEREAIARKAAETRWGKGRAAPGTKEQA